MKEREFSRGTILVRYCLATITFVGSLPFRTNKPRRKITDANRRRLLSVLRDFFGCYLYNLRRVQYYSTAGLPPSPVLCKLK